MTYYKKFIADIKSFDTLSPYAATIHNALLIHAYHELEQRYKHLTTKLSNSSDAHDGGIPTDKQILLNKTKQNKILVSLLMHMIDIEAEAHANSLDLTQKSIPDYSFISEFARHFQNVSQLVDVLADAPDYLKVLTTNVCIAILAKVDKPTQEQQLAALSVDHLEDMLEQAIITYECTEHEATQSQCQHLVHMGMFELIRREQQRIFAQENLQAECHCYQHFLDFIREKLPELRQSNILEHLNLYQNTAGQTIHDLITDVERKLCINLHEVLTDLQIHMFKTPLTPLAEINLNQEAAQMILAQFKEPLAKGAKLLERSNALSQHELAHKIRKYDHQINLLKRQWAMMEAISSANQREFADLVMRWETYFHRLQSIYIKIKKAERLDKLASDSCLADTSRNKLLHTANHVLEETFANPPSAMTIYALLNNDQARHYLEQKKTVQNANKKVLVTINFPQKKLTEKEIETFITEAELHVNSPSGQKYFFSYKDNIPKAMLMVRGTLPEELETPKHYQQRLAITTMNMIDNVLSKSTIVNVNTTNPFIAKIAEQYINHLKHIVKLEMTYFEITGCSYNIQNEAIEQAEKMFTMLAPQLSKKNIKSASWYKEAQKLHQ
ncbi:hypothetical protein [Legionella oakridgensis]|uniref:hypothetical protein n=1 Tax=Legionella oakridgensis TaxID=29423 RepID=UPI0003DE2EC9|nr:hypothetical protein [Legionella oakridgensis]ETO93686.1 hypothetical protein LOR_56c12570 [Legionella oakridgensis RV-2-2007]